MSPFLSLLKASVPLVGGPENLVFTKVLMIPRSFLSKAQLTELVHLESVRQDDSGIEFTTLDLLQQSMPVFLDRCLSTATHCDTLLHQLANEELIGQRGIVSHQRDCTNLRVARSASLGISLLSVSRDMVRWMVCRSPLYI
jgi:hypothetical protein